MVKDYLNSTGLLCFWGKIKNYMTGLLAGKQDTISDLSTIRSGASKGETAVQTETDPVFSASVAAGITDSDITNWNSKTSNIGTVTKIQMNGTQNGPNDYGVVNLGNVVSEVQYSPGDIIIKVYRGSDYGRISLFSLVNDGLDGVNNKIRTPMLHTSVIERILPENYAKGDDDRLYYRYQGDYFPVSHPDISTQVSILPQRFGNLPIKEVLVKEEDGGLDPVIPSKAVIISAFSFNDNACVPAFCKKENGVWTITNNYGIVPDFTLVQYYGAGGDYYYDYYDYYNTYGGDDKPIERMTFGVGIKNNEASFGVQDIWGTCWKTFDVGTVIGFVRTFTSYVKEVSPIICLNAQTDSNSIEAEFRYSTIDQQNIVQHITIDRFEPRLTLINKEVNLGVLNLFFYI